MNDTTKLRISAGRGPIEARRFVAMLADAIREHLTARDVAVLDERRHGDRDAPGRVELRVAAAAARVGSLVGTHLLTAELRGPNARRRWFAEVELDDRQAVPTVVLARHELDIRFVRSRGPGGQNVNKRSTAVQIAHRPTGLAVACDRHRSQARNRAEAMEHLREAVTQHLHHQAREDEQRQAWQTRRELLTREPVMCWRLDPAARDAIVPM